MTEAGGSQPELNEIEHVDIGSASPQSSVSKLAGRRSLQSAFGFSTVEAGKPVQRGFTFRPAQEVPGAVLSYENARQLKEGLAEIDRAQIPGPDGRTR